MEPYLMLEAEYAKYLKVDPQCTVAVSSGTSGLHIALETLQLDLTEDNLVLVPDFTMVACPRAVTLAGLTPKFVDCDPDTYLMDNNQVSHCLQFDKGRGNIKAIMPVHIYGRLCDMFQIHDICSGLLLRDVSVIEDLSEVNTVAPHPESYAGVYSLYKNKIIHGEEGGMIVFRDRGKADLARRLRCLGFTPEHDFYHIPRGINARLSNANALQVFRSLYVADCSVARRKEHSAAYYERLPKAWHPVTIAEVPWVCDFRIRGMTLYQQTELVRNVNKANPYAALRHGFKPMSQQSEYVQLNSSLKVTGSRLKPYEICYLPLEGDWVGNHTDTERMEEIVHTLICEAKQLGLEV